jgi:hypothetical protein
MADYSLDVLLQDQEAFVKELFEKDEELVSCYRKHPPQLQTELRKESVAGIRAGLEKFIKAENRIGYDHGMNILDYDFARFNASADIKTEIVSRLASSKAVREQLVDDFIHGLFDSTVDSIAYVVSEAYRAHLTQLYLGEIKPRASPADTPKSS